MNSCIPMILYTVITSSNKAAILSRAGIHMSIATSILRIPCIRLTSLNALVVRKTRRARSTVGDNSKNLRLPSCSITKPAVQVNMVIIQNVVPAGFIVLSYFIIFP